MLPVWLNRTVILSLLLVASVSTSFAADAKKAAPQRGGGEGESQTGIAAESQVALATAGFPSLRRSQGGDHERGGGAEPQAVGDGIAGRGEQFVMPETKEKNTMSGTPL